MRAKICVYYCSESPFCLCLYVSSQCQSSRFFPLLMFVPATTASILSTPAGKKPHRRYILYIILTALFSSPGVCRSTNWQEMAAPASCSQTTVRGQNARGMMSTSMTPCLVRCCMDTTTKPSKSTWDRYSK